MAGVLILVWTFYSGFGFSYHYHPEYTHAHAGQMEPHKHLGTFHSAEVERLAEVIAHQGNHLQPGETHHHSETTPGSDAETNELGFNKNSIPPLKLQALFPADSVQTLDLDTDTVVHGTLSPEVPVTKVLKLPPSILPRSPPTLSL